MARSKAVSQAMRHRDAAGAGAAKRSGLSPKNKVGAVLSEFKRGTLRTSAGPHVKSRKQAIAIALSEAREAAKKRGGSMPKGLKKPGKAMVAKLKSKRAYKA